MSVIKSYLMEKIPRLWGLIRILWVARLSLILLQPVLLPRSLLVGDLVGISGGARHGAQTHAYSPVYRPNRGSYPASSGGERRGRPRTLFVQLTRGTSRASLKERKHRSIDRDRNARSWKNPQVTFQTAHDCLQIIN